MRLRNYSAALTVGATLFLMYGLSGCQPVSDTPAPAVSTPASPPTIGKTDTASPTKSGGPAASVDAVKDAVADALAVPNAPFPEGTHLENCTIDADIATLDFNSKFSALANLGESTESLAQKSLRAALSKFPSIQKMRVTVAGRPFDSQATDWNTPFPVRETAASSDKSSDSSAPDQRQ